MSGHCGHWLLAEQVIVTAGTAVPCDLLTQPQALAHFCNSWLVLQVSPAQLGAGRGHLLAGSHHQDTLSSREKSEILNFIRKPKFSISWFCFFLSIVQTE